MTSKTLPEERDYHHSMRTLPSCDHTLALVPKHEFMRGEKACICVFACMYLSEYVCTDIWPKKRANTPKPSEKGSMSRVKVSNMAYLATSLSSCHSSDVKEDSSSVLNTHIQTLLGLLSVKLKQIAL